MIELYHAYLWLVAAINGNNTYVPGNAVLYSLGLLAVLLRKEAKDVERHEGLRQEIADLRSTVLHPAEEAEQHVAEDIEHDTDKS